jgi:hypothetical protein
VLFRSAGLFLCGAAKDESPAQAPQGPAIRVEPEGFDFGHVMPGKTVRKEFRLRNVGDQDLVLQPARTSCGCTAAIVGEMTLAPGRTTPLTVQLKTGTNRGRIVKSVLVPSNDPKASLLEVKVEATVDEPPAK